MTQTLPVALALPVTAMVTGIQSGSGPAGRALAARVAVPVAPPASARRHGCRLRVWHWHRPGCHWQSSAAGFKFNLKYKQYRDYLVELNLNSQAGTP